MLNGGKGTLPSPQNPIFFQGLDLANTVYGT